MAKYLECLLLLQFLRRLWIPLVFKLECVCVLEMHCETAQPLPKGSGVTASMHHCEHFVIVVVAKLNQSTTVAPIIARPLALVFECVFVLHSGQDHASFFVVYVNVMT